MHGVSCVDVCVNGRGSACTVLFTHACAPVGLHTAYIHTYSGRTYTAHTRGVRVRPVPVWCVCTRVRAGLRARFFFVCAPHTSSHTPVYVHGLPSPTEGQLGLVGMHDRAREVHAHLPRKSCTRRMCAFATACTRDEGTEKTEDATEIEHVPPESAG